MFNDETHHVHDEDPAWSQSLLAIHRALPAALSLWLDFSATPKDQNGMYFPWTVCDYPMAQAAEDRIVKAPLIVSKEDDPKRPFTAKAEILPEQVMGRGLRRMMQVSPDRTQTLESFPLLRSCWARSPRRWSIAPSSPIVSPSSTRW